MRKLTTTALQLLMYWLVVQPSSQASLQAATVSAVSRIRSVKNKTEINICDLRMRDPPFYCHCDNINTYTATTSHCVMLNVLKEDDPFWKDMSVTQPKLERLDIVARVNMSYVPTKTLREFKNLTHIDLKDASIEALVEKAFSDIPSLIEIHATRCSIVHLGKYAFGNMTRLNSIHLNDNRIHEINRDVFVNLPSLKSLVIKHNNLTLVHDHALKHLTTLETLDLSENKINVITSDTFAGLKSLKSLNLRDNAIEMIGDKTFIEIPELQELQLDQNRIELIEDSAFAGLRNLRKLSLSDNKLVSLGMNVLSATSSLNFLDLRSNALQTITFDLVKGIVPDLYQAKSQLYLEDNKFICDCKLAWIFGMRNDTTVKTIRESLGSLTCFLESQSASIDEYEVENNETGIELKRDFGESYEVSKVKDPAADEDEEEYDYDNPTSTPRIETGKLQKVDGKLGYIKRISELKFDDLPCPEQEPLGSGQSSSRQENAPNMIGSASHMVSLGCAHIIAILLILAAL